MNHDLINDADPVPGPPLPGLSARAYSLFRRWFLILIIAGLALAALWYPIGLYADYLWHDHLGYGRPFIYLTLIKVGLFLIPGLLASTVITLNLYVALPLAMGPISRPLPPDFLRLCLALMQVFIYTAILICGLIFGSQAAQNWELVVLLLHQAPFGISDPQFGRDVTFYVVNLQAMRAVQGWLLALCITAIGITVGLHAFIYVLRGLNIVIAPRTLRHIAGLGIWLMLVLALHHVVNIYELALSEGGVVIGATYTDVNARIPVYWFLAGIALLAAAGFGVAVRYVGLRLMAGAFSLWLIMFLLAGIFYPALFQRFRVSPDEFAREQIYIQRNIDGTRAAYGLENVQEVQYPAAESLTLEAVDQYRGTMDGIRLWDAAPLQAAYNQLQFMELYYNFLNMDSDRYLVDGQVQQVLIAARELDPENLPGDAQNWVNQRLQYTHGYGVSMTPATGYTLGEGRPEYLIQDIPIKGQLPVSRPEVYYGESPIEFAIVNSGMSEVNPGSDTWNYDGKGGVALDSWVRRILFTLKFADINILLSDQVSAGADPVLPVEPALSLPKEAGLVPAQDGVSTLENARTGPARIQFYRHVGERVKAIAPFLKLDRDPYPVLDQSGELWWIQDAYTVTDGYPYSTPAEQGFNYIRNSIKAVINAYTGDVDLYVMDPDEPILQMYRDALPSLFKPFEEMPEDLQSHIRYPITLFSAQANTYLRYHVTDPQVFFNQAEQWDIPLETRLGKDGVRVTPSYILMRLPGENDPEFVVQMPFSPAGQKKNLVGLLVARSDLPYYGQLRSYHLPDDRQIDGPSQVEARIENDQDFSQLFTLWQGAGSEIIRGRLLAIPIADTIVYVEPLYLQSEFLEFPELKKVILADNTNLVMADTMAEAVARLTGAELIPSPSTGEGQDGGDPARPGLVPAREDGDDGAGTLGGAPAQDGPALTQDQLQQLDQIEATIDELGEALEDLDRSLQNLRDTLGGNSP